MCLARTRRKSLYAATAAVALIAVTAVIALYTPGPNVVSAEVYSNEVGFIKVDTADDGAVLASVPLILLGDSPHYGLNNLAGDGLGEIGAMLAADLNGSTTSSGADKVIGYDGVSYRLAWLYDDGVDVLWLEDAAPSTLTLQPGEAFWILSAAQQIVTFLGEVRTDETVEIVIDPGYNMISWPYPTTLILQLSSLHDDGAYGATVSTDADCILAYDPVSGYTRHWLYDDGVNVAWLQGAWPSALLFEPGQGYWYFRQPAQGQFTWTCIKPTS